MIHNSHSSLVQRNDTARHQFFDRDCLEAHAADERGVYLCAQAQADYADIRLRAQSLGPLFKRLPKDAAQRLTWAAVGPLVTHLAGARREGVAL